MLRISLWLFGFFLIVACETPENPLLPRSDRSPPGRETLELPDEPDPQTTRPYDRSEGGLAEIPAMIRYDERMTPEQIEALQRAIETWNDAIDLQLLELGSSWQGQAEVAPSSFLVFAPCWGDSLPMTISSTIAFDREENEESARKIAQFTIRLNAETFQFVDLAQSIATEVGEPRPRLDLESVLLSELGRGLGLANFGYNCGRSVVQGSYGSVLRSPTDIDRQGLRHLYLGAPAPELFCHSPDSEEFPDPPYLPLKPPITLESSSCEE